MLTLVVALPLGVDRKDNGDLAVKHVKHMGIQMDMIDKSWLMVFGGHTTQGLEHHMLAISVQCQNSCHDSWETWKLQPRIVRNL